MTTDTKDFSRTSFEFTGRAGEYFGIWIVNIILTILTLGIYSAWAKVRTHQYFYGNTLLEGSAFQYLAKPMQILKSRLIAAAIFSVYYSISNIYPVLGMGLLIFIFLLVPAIVVLSMSFRMRNTAHRNVTFDFDRNFKRAYLIFAGPIIAITLLFIAAIFTEISNAELITEAEQLKEDPSSTMPFAMLGVMLLFIFTFPLWEYLQTQFLVDHTKYGTSPFKLKARASTFYKFYIMAIITFIATGALFGMLVAAVLTLGFSFDVEENPALMSMIIAGCIFPIYLWMFTYIQTKKANLIYNQTLLDPESSASTFESKLTVTYMFFLYLTNTLAIILSFGLLIPWTMIRTARYRAKTITLLSQISLDSFAADQQKKVGAFGEEFGEMFDIEVGI